MKTAARDYFVNIVRYLRCFYSVIHRYFFTRDLSYARLVWFRARLPRYELGEFAFDFGKLRYVDIASLESQYFEIFCQHSYDFMPDKINPVIFDCGGHIGLSAIWFKLRYPQSQITVFEADPLIAEVLKHNVETLKLRDVKVVEAAVWASSGAVGFDNDNADSGRILLENPKIIVPSVCLADWINQPIDLLKMDIEGSEYDVILDLCRTGKIALVKRLVCEVHGRNLERERLVEVLVGLVQHGFVFTFSHARSAPDLPGASEPTPFCYAAPDAKFLLHLYAWQHSDL